MNAVPRHLKQSPVGVTKVDQEGAMLIPVETLARFGGGDAAVGRRELRSLLAAERTSPTHSGPTKRPESVRIATPADEMDVFELLIHDLADNAAHIAPIDEAKVLETIRSGTRQRGGFVGVIGRPAIAVVVLVPYQWWWANTYFFQEVVNYVHPDHRRSRHADDLLDFSKWATDEMTRGFGYQVRLLCGVLGAWRVQAKIALYRRRFWQCGAAFVYPAPPIKEG